MTQTPHPQADPKHARRPDGEDEKRQVPAVDLDDESVAGEEDPGAALDLPAVKDGAADGGGSNAPDARR
ncbi:MAG: hypothetical protein EOO54_16195 [Haliea sp.]|nr:MAG: hypothetical protein EOO54_16195 [Haliea sp.]